MSARGSATMTAVSAELHRPQTSTSVSKNAQSVPRNINNIDSIGSNINNIDSINNSKSGDEGGPDTNENVLSFEPQSRAHYRASAGGKAEVRSDDHPVSPGRNRSRPVSPENIANSNGTASEEAIEGNSGESEETHSSHSGGGDLQFKKTDFRKSRTQSFQSVLSSASLKSLKHQFSAQTQPQLKRNPSTISQSNTRNFQSFIQAPVLSSVTNLRQTDDVEIGQRLPFDHSKGGSDAGAGRRSRKGSFEAGAAGAPSALGKSANPAYNPNTASNNATTEDVDVDADTDTDVSEDEDTYKEETTLQQQRLTQNALKKLSLSLAPIIRSEEDDVGPQARQLTTKSLNSSRPVGGVGVGVGLKPRPARDLRPVLRTTASRKTKPYLPAEVDLSSFSSLTRQSKSEAVLPVPASASEAPAPGQHRTDSNALTQNATRSQIHGSSSEKQVQNFGKNHGHNSGQSAGQNAKHSYAHASVPSPAAGAASKFASLDRTPEPRGDSMHTKSSINIHSGGSSMTMGGPRPGTTVGDAEQRKPANTARSTHMSATLNQRDLNVGAQKSGSGSITSGKSHGSERKLQQINGLRSPMYVPAVLRMTIGEPPEFGVGGGGDEHQRESHVHVHTGDAHEAQTREANSSATSVKSVDSAFSLEPSASPNYHAKSGPYELSKRQYDYILRAAPTRKHWVKDESVVECGISVCRKKFTFFERRHHCRKCGGIFCKEHTSHYLYINHLAQFTTGGRGTLSRVCDRCIDEYNDFMQHEFGVTCHRPSSRESLPQQTALNKVDYRKEIFAQKMAHNAKNGSSSGTSSGNIPMKRPDTGEETSASDQMAGSVPANWSWSSF